MQFNRELLEAGAFVAGDALHPSASATTVRFGEGDQTVTDGPFAETKEQLGGYYVLECADLDEALGVGQEGADPAGERRRGVAGDGLQPVRLRGSLRGRGEGLSAAAISTGCSGASRDGRSPP